MVRDAAQLYTIEGIAAALIMILTAFFVVNATTVYTAGDSHISDMQLEILGSDALKMIDTAPNSTVGKSPLQTIVEQDDTETFKTLFLNLTNNRTDIGPDRIQFSTNVSYHNTVFGVDTIESYPFVSSRALTGGEHAVRVTKWVIVNKRLPLGSPFPSEDRAVLVEVLIWRD